MDIHVECEKGKINNVLSSAFFSLSLLLCYFALFCFFVAFPANKNEKSFFASLTRYTRALSLLFNYFSFFFHFSCRCKLLFVGEFPIIFFRSIDGIGMREHHFYETREPNSKRIKGHKIFYAKLLKRYWTGTNQWQIAHSKSNPFADGERKER